MKKLFTYCLAFVGMTTAYIGAAEPDLLPEIKERRSIRNYDASKSVSADDIAALVEAARWSPSAHNAQPWNFIICDKSTNQDAYNKLLNCIEKTHQKWVQKAPLLILIVSGGKSDSTQYGNQKDSKKNRWAEYDTGGAASQMTLQAVYMGLASHQVSDGCDQDKIRKEFSIPQDYNPMAVMVVGYEDKSGPDYEQSDRYPVKQNFFNGVWGKGYSISSEYTRNKTDNSNNGNYNGNNNGNRSGNNNGNGWGSGGNSGVNNGNNSTYYQSNSSTSSTSTSVSRQQGMNNPTPGTGLNNPTSPNTGATMYNDRRADHLESNNPNTNSLRTRTNYNEGSEMDGSGAVDNRNR